MKFLIIEDEIGVTHYALIMGFKQIGKFYRSQINRLVNLIFSITTTLYIFIAVKFLEEKDLLKVHGKTLEDYQKRVPMIIPFIGK